MKAFFADIQETGLVPDRGAQGVGRASRAADRGAEARSARRSNAGSPRHGRASTKRTAPLAAVDERWEKRI